jgi:predicted DNA-binding transcriptional regulator YafY
MQPSDIEAAQAMLADPNLRVAMIANWFGVSVPTFYRYVPAERSRMGVKFEGRAQESRALMDHARGTHAHFGRQ